MSQRETGLAPDFEGREVDGGERGCRRGLQPVSAFELHAAARNFATVLSLSSP